MGKKDSSQSYAEEARLLFADFASRHGLVHEADTEAPVDLLWNFPVQKGLRHPVFLMLQDDELHFGVGAIQAGFFPFPKEADAFSLMLDEWMAGRIRVAPMRLGGKLQRLQDGAWRTFYNAVSLSKSGRQLEVLWNGIQRDNEVEN